MLNISGLNSGVVIDHIKAGRGMDIYSYLELDKYDNSVAIIKNAKSEEMGRKDIIKIESPLDVVNLDILGYLDHNITVNIIHNGEISEKKILRLPKTIKNVLKCRNPRCITSVEQDLPHSFRLTNPHSKTYRCIYCEQEWSRK